MKSGIIITAVLIGSVFVALVGIAAAANIPGDDASFSSVQDHSTYAEEGPSQRESVMEARAECSLSETYPPAIRQWCPLIEQSAWETGLPATLIAAVIFQESSGDSLAYSSSGAVGLMQVMPRDGLAEKFVCINGPCFSDRPTINALQDPTFNITYGSQMLADLYQRHGTYREALYRYGPINMGYDYADLVLSIWTNHTEKE